MDKADFVAMAISDIKGNPNAKIEEQKISEQVGADSPSKSEFVNIAIADLTGKSKQLSEAFSSSVNKKEEDVHIDVSSITEKFRAECDSEIRETISKLLKGVK